MWLLCTFFTVLKKHLRGYFSKKKSCILSHDVTVGHYVCFILLRSSAANSTGKFPCSSKTHMSCNWSWVWGSNKKFNSPFLSPFIKVRIGSVIYYKNFNVVICYKTSSFYETMWMNLVVSNWPAKLRESQVWREGEKEWSQPLLASLLICFSFSPQWDSHYRDDAESKYLDHWLYMEQDLTGSEENSLDMDLEGIQFKNNVGENLT